MAKLHLISETVQLSYPRKEYTIYTMLSHPLKVIKPAFDELQEE